MDLSAENVGEIIGYTKFECIVRAYLPITRRGRWSTQSPTKSRPFPTPRAIVRATRKNPPERQLRGADFGSSKFRVARPLGLLTPQMVREGTAWLSELARKRELGVTATGDWRDPDLFWHPYVVDYVRYSAYKVWHYAGWNADPHVSEPPEGLAGYAAEIKFSLDDSPLVVVRFRWTGGTVVMEEFTRQSAEPRPATPLATNVPSAAAAQDVVVERLSDPAFWEAQLYRYWGAEGSSGSERPGDGSAES